MRRPYRERKLIRALRGTDGYGVQLAAWDATLPDWRHCLGLVLDLGRTGPWTRQDQLDVEALSATLRADGGLLAGPWYQLLMQSLYRGHPGLGGWFPT